MFKNKKWLIILVLTLFLPSILGIVHHGFFASDDGNWMVIRFSAFYESLRAGQFPVRFLMRLNNGYGYPVADFLYPLFMYVGVPIKAVGFSFLTTIKIVFACSMIGSGIVTFFWLKKLFSLIASILGALVYVYFPYHLYDVYQRGSIGEVLALAIVPFILWQIERKNLLFVSIGIALLILSHNILALLFLPIIIGYLLVRKVSIVNTGLIIFEGLGLSAFFWMPALYDKQYTVFDSISVSDFSHYFITPVTMSLIGVIGILGILIGAISLMKQRNMRAGYIFAVGLVALFFCLPMSASFWHMLPLGTYVQFPFRLLSVSILTTSFLIAYGYDVLFSKRFRWVSIVGILLIAALGSYHYLMPSAYETYPDGWYSTNMDTTTIKNEYMPTWVKQTPSNYPTEKVLISNTDNTGTIDHIVSTANKLQFEAFVIQNSILTINTIYFPGWVVLANGRKQSIDYANPKGLITFRLTPGKYSIQSEFTETPIRMESDLTSVLAIMSMSLFSLLKLVKRERKKVLYNYAN